MNRKIISRTICIVVMVVMTFSTGTFICGNSVAYASDNSPNYTVEIPSQVTLVSKGKTRVKVQWNRISNADGYELFIYNNATRAFSLMKRLSGNNNVAVTVNKLSKKKTYSFKVRAYRIDAGETQYSNFSYVVKGRPSGKKKNVSKLKSKKSTYYISRGKSVKLKIKKSPGKRLVSKAIYYSSSNPSVARVSSKGNVTAVGYGTAYITARSHNGKQKVITVYVSSKYADTIPVLTYHNITSYSDKRAHYRNNQWMGSVSDFSAQMKYLHDNGYKTISMDEFYNWYTGQVQFQKKTVAITFDDGLVGVYTYAMPILKKYGFKATVFAIGKNLDKEEPNIEETTEGEETGESNPASENPDDQTLNDETLLPEDETPNVLEDNTSQVTSISETDMENPDSQVDNQMIEKEGTEESEETVYEQQVDNALMEQKEETNRSYSVTDKIDAYLADIIAEQYPNIEFQSHSYNFHHSIGGKSAVFTKSLEEINTDFESNSANGFSYIAYPYGDYSIDFVNSAKDYGYKLGFGFGHYVNASRQDKWYNINRVKIDGQMSIKEFKSKVAPH